MGVEGWYVVGSYERGYRAGHSVPPGELATSTVVPVGRGLMHEVAGSAHESPARSSWTRWKKLYDQDREAEMSYVA